MIAAIRRQATGRNVIVMLAAVGMVALISHGLALPAYRAVASGLDPFDIQFPLTREMVAIQRGAFGVGVAPAYVSFAILNSLFQGMTAVFYALFWAWIMAKSPRPLARGALLVFPVLAVVCGIAENAGFLILVFSNAHDPRHDVTTATLAVHRVKFFLRDADMAITLTLAAFAMYFRRRASAVGKTKT